MDNIELNEYIVVANKIIAHSHWDDVKDTLHTKGKYVAELIADIFGEYIKHPKENKQLIKLVPFDDYPEYKNKGISLHSKEHFLMSMQSQKLIKNLKLDILKKFGEDTPLSASYEYLCAEFLLELGALNYMKKILDEVKKDLVLSFSFDNKKSILKIGNKPIDIAYKSNQFHILDAIFSEDINKELFFSELGEKIDYVKKTKNTDKYWYNHTDPIKKKIREQTGIDDFLITSSHSVRINPKYIV